LVLDADEQNLLDAVDGRKVLYELVNTPPLTSRTTRASSTLSSPSA